MKIRRLINNNFTLESLSFLELSPIALLNLGHIVGLMNRKYNYGHVAMICVDIWDEKI